MVPIYRTVDTKRLFLDTIQREFVRKSIHLMIALVPTMAAWNYQFTVILLIVGILVYTYAEFLRGKGQSVPIISELTALASRDRDKGHFVLGPVTLGIGALSALLLYPHPAATIAIYALAFGDGFSSLAGKLFGGKKIPWTGGKTVAGSLTCFLSVLTAGLFLSDQLLPVLIIAIGATILEALPSKDLDNIIIPIGTGLIADFIAF
ncbi:phosphatidate cytidylyltransferase [Oceanispirochaeta sp.]|jgi:phytol kinase|uniref:diacylglycerol/polyprenol kinase family protein n=1 Tax=Oceanispirochaeta sp. TaxID=2035350 RepID=UPI0026251FCC|nr:phosphatidate cytidylyltransferase [Oceanispirochaeta sp.]MDA3956447.1 phosphatidate cytidylyltransferase [Oceanispirochaeta sp.]